MTNTEILANLPALSFDRLAIAYGIAEGRAHAAKRGTGAYGRALALRGRIVDEVSSRGAVVRKAADGGYMVGRPSDFEPIR
jgi:hypothetical protein